MNRIPESGSNVSSTPSECADFPAQLVRPFRIIAFDWDGTAVMSRQEDASAVRQLIEKLLEQGVYVVVITGTNFPNIDRQFSAAIRGAHKQHLYVSTNRGSEVYGFDARSNPVPIWQRIAKPDENRLLTVVADSVRQQVVARTNLDIRVIYNRMNRRKIDLIPLPEWRDPPKSEIGQLLQAVEARLKGSGIAGGLHEVFELAEREAQKKGLKDARITSDVKHIEIGLTDKSDAINWMMRDLARTRGVPPEEILIGGDEFGPIAGFEGSDYRMVTPEARKAAFVSVGLEPNGTPPDVVHIGGGPQRFKALLACQVALHKQIERGEPASATEGDPLELPSSPTPDPAWLLVEEGFNQAREHEIESLFAVANGYVGTRGALDEGSRFSSPGSFVAGVFDVSPLSGGIPELMMAPDWTHLQVTVEGHELKLEEGEVLEHRRVLDMRQGILWRDWLHQDPAGRKTRLEYLRLASLADRHILMQLVLIRPENYSGRITLESSVERLVGKEHVSETPDAWQIAASTATVAAKGSAVSSNVEVLEQRTSGTGVTVALAFTGRLLTEEGSEIRPEIRTTEDKIVNRWDFEAEIGRGYRLDRLVSIHTSRDVPQGAMPADVAARHLEALASEGVEKILEAHVEAWKSRWEACDVEVEGDEEAQHSLRFAIYHLVSAANPEDERVSVGARALTGEAYKGHVFWDTEIYMLPFYTFTYPSAARALLMYRYHTLPAARDRARSLGYRGALFAWESADTGQDTTPSFLLTPSGEVIRVLSGEQEHHISSDVAYAVWQYWQVTGDDEFFIRAGAEIVLETARFWASRGRIEEDGKCHIRKVIGPDEYHESVDDNAYTNVMAQWNLERGEETARILQERWPQRWTELADHLGIGEEELGEWQRLAKAMYTGFNPQTGLFEQFSGYFDLEDIDLATYEPRVVPIDVLLGRQRVARSKVVKQADVVMLIYLLWDRFPPQVREANFWYYEPRTGHGSSLSPSIHALVAARLGEDALAQRYFQQAAEIDLANNMGNAAGGVHAAALGGLWQAAVFGFGGVYLRGNQLALEPHLSEHWRSLRFSLQQGRESRVTICEKPQAIELRLEGKKAIQVVQAGGNEAVLAPGQQLVSQRESGKWEPWREGQG